MSDTPTDEVDALATLTACAAKTTSMLEWMTTSDLVLLLVAHIEGNSRRRDDLARFIVGYDALAIAGIPLVITFRRARA
jgi:uncharacterized protein (DUF488 family)